MGRRQRNERAASRARETQSAVARGHAAAKRAGEIVLDALGRNPLFVAAALPAKVWPPLFNRYAGGEQFGMHVDNAVRLKRGGVERLRSDLSATLFLSDPDSTKAASSRSRTRTARTP